MKITNKIDINHNLIIQEVEEETFLFDPEKSILHSLNETGAFIFRELQEKNSLQDIAEALTKRYKVSREQAIKDVTSIIGKMRKKKIIE